MTLQEFKEYLDKFLAENPELADIPMSVYNESQMTHHEVEIVRDMTHDDYVSIVIFDDTI